MISYYRKFLNINKQNNYKAQFQDIQIMNNITINNMKNNLKM